MVLRYQMKLISCSAGLSLFSQINAVLGVWQTIYAKIGIISAKLSAEEIVRQRSVFAYVD
jgi:hypothetical protein